MLPDCQKFLNRKVQTFGHVFHDENDQNHGKSLKLPWYVLNEISMVTHQLDCCGRDSSKKLFWNLDGRKYQIGNACSFIENSCFSSVYVDDIKVTGKKQNMLPCGRN